MDAKNKVSGVSQERRKKRWVRRWIWMRLSTADPSLLLALATLLLVLVTVGLALPALPVLVEFEEEFFEAGGGDGDV